MMPTFNSKDRYKSRYFLFWGGTLLNTNNVKVIS